MGFGAKLRAYLLAGVLITAPISITLYLAWAVVSFIDARVTPLIPARYNPESYLPFAVPGLGVLVLIVLLILIGALTAGYVGRLLLRIYEGLLSRMPIVRSVYGAIKQIIETILAQQSPAFSQAVLVEYPRRGLWAIAFITGTTEGEVQNITDEEVINVFLPTTPNPTSGFLLFVPRRDLIPLSMSVEDAAKMVVSGGIVTPPDRRSPEQRARSRITVAGRDNIDIVRVQERQRPALGEQVQGRDRVAED
ncbi:MAG: DUF502 domain-containing protein [Rhodospirillales bacterium]|nr:DUF502 domain-containing protein [Rhodospirillales bacterium]